MRQTSSEVLQVMSGQQQISLTQAQADKARADADLIRTQEANARTEGAYIAPTAEQKLLEGKANVAEKTQATIESQARTATIDAMRNHQVNSLVQDIAKKAQETKTEEQRTREMTEIANTAKQLWGARAGEAATLAAQAATYYKNHFLTVEAQKIDQRNLEIELLKNKNFQLVIDNILQNQYGRMLTWSKVFDNPIKVGAAVANATNKDYAGPVVKGGQQP